jgi:hypothetical protein
MERILSQGKKHDNVNTTSFSNRKTLLKMISKTMKIRSCDFDHRSSSFVQHFTKKIHQKCKEQFHQSSKFNCDAVPIRSSKLKIISALQCEIFDFQERNCGTLATSSKSMIGREIFLIDKAFPNLQG